MLLLALVTSLPKLRGTNLQSPTKIEKGKEKDSVRVLVGVVVQWVFYAVMQWCVHGIIHSSSSFFFFYNNFLAACLCCFFVFFIVYMMMMVLFFPFLYGLFCDSCFFFILFVGSTQPRAIKHLTHVHNGVTLRASWCPA